MINTVILICSIFIISIIIKNIAIKYCSKTGMGINGTYTLPDIIHKKFKQRKAYNRIGNTLLILFPIIVILYTLFTKNINALLFFVSILAFINLFTIIYFVATIPPDSKNGECRYSMDILDNIRHLGSCNNLNISGHLLTIGFSMYILSYLQGHKYMNIYILMYILSFISISASRNHYTIDCINSTVLLLLLITQKDNIIKMMESITGESVEF